LEENVNYSHKTDSKHRALEILQKGVQQIMSSNGWRQALEFRSRFHTYSFLNSTLIVAQRPNARLVAGYRKWQELGRQVQKGEKGIAILAPIVKRDDEDTDLKVIVGFRTVKVFDIGQTEGAAIPQPDPPKLLEGDSPSISAALGALEDYCQDIGLQLRRDLDHTEALGVYRPTTKSISLRSDLSKLQELKTLTHELAHALLHDLSSERSQAELEAESCAFLVLHDLGLDTNQYSFAYLAHWADSLEALVAAGERASQTAQKILAVLKFARA
jgi:antirestriction protein ArdC